MPERRASGGGTWRSEKSRTTARVDGTQRTRTSGESSVSAPERPRWNAGHEGRAIGAPATPPSLVSRVDRLPRQMPVEHANGSSGLVAPNLGRAPIEPITPVHSAHAAVDVNCFWSNPCNRFSCWHGCNGCEFGFVFCNTALWCYWLHPGCAPCFYPYTYYYWPSCYYLPAYYPTYADVVVVHDYDSGATQYPPISDRTEPAPAHAPNPDELIANGWEQFRGRDYPAAIDSFRDAVLASPTDATAKVAYAQALFAIGNYPDAAFMLRRAMELQPDLPALGEDPRTRYADPEDHAEQMLALRSFLDRVKGEPAATLVLGWQSYFTGDLGAARESFDALKNMDPEDETVKRFLARLGPAAPAAK